MKKIFFTLFLVSVFCGFSQEEETPEEREDFGNQMFEIGEFDLSKKIFEDLIKEDSSNSNYYYRLGLSIMELTDPEDALPYLMKAKSLGHTKSLSGNLKKDRYNDKYYSFDLDFALARGYHLSGNFENAIEYYQKYLNRYALVEFSDKEIASLYQNQAIIGLNLDREKKNVKIVNMGPRINSKYNDYGAQVYQDTSSLIFTRQQPNRNPKSIKIDDTFKEDIYISYKRKDGKWIEPFRIGSGINNDTQDDFAAALYDNDKKLIVHYENGKLFEFERIGTTWANTSKMNKDIFARSITISENIMVISSDFYASLGGFDLLMATKKEDGTWSEFKPLPSSINTIYDENYPFIDPIDKSLYFSSNSDKSSGGYDVFKAEMNPLTNTWEKAENIGYPINTPRDDIYFTFHSSSKVAFYNSQRKDSYGGLDIYTVDYSSSNSQIVNVTLKIQSKDSIPKPITTNYKIQEEGSSIALDFVSDSLGIAKMELLSNRNYMLIFESENYEILDTVLSLHTDKTEMLALIRLETLEEGKKYTLTSVQFDRDEAKIKNMSYAELNKFYEFLMKHPKLAIEVSGHTELGGLDSQNKILSQARADAVKDYLVRKGIDSKRILAVGYGSKFPISKGNSEEDKSLNRRTEVILHHFSTKDSEWKPYYSK